MVSVLPLQFLIDKAGTKWNRSNVGITYLAKGGLAMLRKGPSRLMPCFASPVSSFIAIYPATNTPLVTASSRNFDAWGFVYANFHDSIHPCESSV